ncbi:shikimate kinase [Bradyrhizobium sp. CCGUVB4N]|uniref:shikimate kinase n=1 Tax=Bradyrhizobium sp. CCGUVB4N TaxID=2949631 RepID=UPI0020B2C373|nr:shikimate kinase [Bradyrhizobium sp. CCGUVB4N]MCP3380115.1 shikimate kinase [Bradyrhizobium sp. CCGUVB4N]
MGDVPERPIQGERPERPHRSSNGAANREASLLHSDGGRWRADQAAESLQPAARPAHRQSVSGLSNVPERLHVDKATAQNVQGAISDSYSSRSDKLNAALREIASARNIGTFSRKVVHHKGELKGKDLSEFLRNAAGRFDARFVAQLEENIRSSWGYATTCNAVSGDAGGQAGMRACRALAAQVSRLDKALLTQVDLRAFSLFASSFGRHPRATECRDGTVKIAEFCCAESGLLETAISKELALLVNGFSKWPEEATCRDATIVVACDVRDLQLSDFKPQDLANLVNGFSKWPEAATCRDATVAIAGEIGRRLLSDFTPQALANLVNGFSKWPEAAACREASVAIAEATVAIANEPPRGRLSEFTPQHLANLVNGFSKWPNAADCCEATVAIAEEIGGRQLSDFAPHELANLVNGFSKWPEAAACREASVAIAEATVAIANEPPRGRLSEFNHRHLTNMVNGFSKWREEPDCRDATVAIADEIRRRQLSDFTPQELANLVNGYGKWPDAATCREAAAAIASVVRDLGPSDFTPQGLANLVNGFSKWPEAADCGEATVAIAGDISRRELSDFEPRHVANLVNGFSKWPEATDCREAAVAIAGEISRRELSDFEPLHVTNLVNGFSKWPEAAACREATVAIAAAIPGRGLSDFTPQELSNLVNGYSKWPETATCGEATAAIASVVRHFRLSDFAPRGLANLVNGFNKWPDEVVCHQAVIDIARGLGTGGRRFGAFTTRELSMIANALGRSIVREQDTGEVTQTALLSDRLRQLAHHLQYATHRLEQADVLSIGNIFKALGKAQLFDDLGLLASTGLNRLAQLHRAPGFAAENNLETLGNLCVALLPLARSPQKPLRWHRRQALVLLNDLQSVVEQKIEAHLAASDAERTRGPLATRCPALSIYQVLKARAVLETLYRRPHVEGKRSDLGMRQQALRRGTRQILAGARDLIQSDLSKMSWNLIAQIEAESPVDVLDPFMAQEAQRIQAQHSAAVFDVHQLLRTMDHEPRPPQGDAGLMQLPVVDLQGRRVATEPETRYSIFHRLTSGTLPVVAVQLPAKPSVFMLARTVTVEGVPYRMDLFGGSKLKPPKPTVSQIAARAPGEQPAASSGGKLLAIPYADTAPGTAFEQLSRAWAPFKEAYYYTQRRGFAAPPAIKDLGPHDYALEGTFKLLLLPDRPATEEHPFKLTGPQGPIALRPHDGCGFIKASLAERMPAVRRAGHRDGSDRMHAFGEGRRSSLPASALQHYPRSAQVADEAREKATIWLERKQGDKLTSEELFRTVTAGHIDGPGAVAVPSDDGCLHVPTLKSDTLTGKSGVLLGRSPYDKPNLRPFEAERVRSAVDGDSTAAFMDQCVAMQYSFNVAQKSAEHLSAEDPTFFAKGILIVVPDEMWPANYAGQGLVMSAEDVKSHSNWTKRKDRVTEDTPVDCVGILQATELFAPGSLVAVPIDEQKKLDGDFDGDTAIVIADRPQLYEHVRQFDQAVHARGFRSLKPPKSHTPAIEGETYHFGRASQILAATQDVLEMYSCLQRDFLAQSHDARRWFAERAVFGTFEGIHHELKRDIRDLLNQDQVRGQDIQDKLERARDEIEAADHPVAGEVAELLISDLEAWVAGADQQVLSEGVDSGSDAIPTLSPALSELFPELAATYPATPDPRHRVQALLDHYPARIDPRPDGYDADDLLQSTTNLLSLGIKVGTDAYKSDTGARNFMKKGQALQRLLQRTPDLQSVPYSKGLAATLNQGRFDADATMENLKDNPTLAASIMEASIKLAVEKQILPGLFDRQPVAEDSAVTVTLTRDETAERSHTETARARVEEREITRTATSVAETLRRAGIPMTMPHFDRRLRSESSIRDQLTGMSVPSGSVAQLVSNAVRHVFEVPDKDFTRAFKAAMLAFDARGYAEISTTNWFRRRNPSFVGIKTVLATPDDYRFEVEFHTPDSYRAKIDNHDAYKQLEKLHKQASGDALEQGKAHKLVQSVRDLCKEVAIPDGANDIPHWGVDAGIRGGASAAFGLQAAEQPGSRERSDEANAIVAALGARPIVLVGLPGAGKSTIGRYLARRLGLRFIDSDKQIEQATDMSISKIFDAKGPQWFRDSEANVIAQCVEKGNVVLATGGGAFEREETRRLIQDKGVSIWLDTNRDEIWKRLANDTSRPLLQIEKAEDSSGAESSNTSAIKKERFEELIAQRTPHYRQADLTVVPCEKRDNKNADACVQALHTYLCQQGAPDQRRPGDQLQV